MTTERPSTSVVAVMAGFVPAIHVFPRVKTWMPATSAGMTKERFRFAKAKGLPIG
jgi:hypothetical protein